MATMDKNHTTLTDGVGKCSVPMWMNGCPAGFCDEPAYGERPVSKEFFNHSRGIMMRQDLKYDGYVPGLACPCHGGPEKPLEYDPLDYME
jgi:hypothetical protein